MVGSRDCLLLNFMARDGDQRKRLQVPFVSFYECLMSRAATLTRRANWSRLLEQ